MRHLRYTMAQYHTMELKEFSWETINFEGMSRQLCQQMQIIHAFQLLSIGWPHAEYTQTQKKKACHSHMTRERNRVTQKFKSISEKTFRKLFPSVSQQWDRLLVILASLQQ